MTIGVLALQGCIDPHIKMLERLGQNALRITSPDELKGIDRLILPGGESTTMLKLLEITGLGPEIKSFAKQHPVWGVCAGAILLATQVSEPEQTSLGLINIHAKRNHYGSQIDSFKANLRINPLEKTIAVDFIRAPLLRPLAKSVQILANYDAQPVLMREGNILVSSFHSELGDNSELHAYFLSL